ncbi:alkaline phosphatase [Erysipelothrix larvae]|uniref:histidine kinase n=1 Tax=Erysipelothrix larvae TaxID=1514105 RepID=A0A0X8GZL6_9FIRM|nr:HAMP domain-containing sensor histidine kinase [Erysipelothrix larvae]AMC93370.1 alkaline phosphatase [Erysipelothrix larvae]
MLSKQNKMILFAILGFSTLAYLTRENEVLMVLFLVMDALSVFGIMFYQQKELEHKKASEFEGKIASVEQQLSFETEKLDHIIQAIPSAMCYVDQKGNFDTYNSKFRDLVGDEVHDVYASNVGSSLHKIFLDAFLGEKHFYKQVVINSVDYQVLSVPIFFENRYNGCILVFQDVTLVREGEKMQKRFIADASHELKTPIAAIKGMHEILTREGFDDKEAMEEFKEQITLELTRLEKIVEDLLLQSKLSTNKVHLEKSRFNLNDFFQGLIYRRRSQLHNNNIKVVLNCASDLELEADQFRLSQVFINLFNNAINYSKDQSIRIDCELTEKTCIIKFSDTGAGISEDVLPHIFERFFRGQSDRNRNDGNSGLGLAISKSIVEAHGGTLSVASKLGKGTTFTIALPIA